MTNQTYTSRRRQVFSQDLTPYESTSCVLYLIELDPSVMGDVAFAKKNPKYKPGMNCYYVGMTSLDPRERFEQHIRGTKNVSRIAHQFGRTLRMDLISSNEPTRKKWVLQRESRLTRHLRSQGYGAWHG